MKKSLCRIGAEVLVQHVTSPKDPNYACKQVGEVVGVKFDHKYRGSLYVKLRDGRVVKKRLDSADHAKPPFIHPERRREVWIRHRLLGSQGRPVLKDLLRWEEPTGAHIPRFYLMEIHDSWVQDLREAQAELTEAYKAYSKVVLKVKTLLSDVTTHGALPIGERTQFEKESYMSAIDSIVKKIDNLWEGSSLSSIFTKIKDAGQIEDVNTVLANTFKAVEGQLEDGLQIADAVPILSAALTDIMNVAEGLQGVSGEEKLDFVTSMFVGLYNFVDKGIDGDKNRINIPWVPDMIENFLEKRVLPVAVRFAIEAVVKVWNKRS
jgi:hypothetical protein